MIVVVTLALLAWTFYQKSVLDERCAQALGHGATSMGIGSPLCYPPPVLPTRSDI